MICPRLSYYIYMRIYEYIKGKDESIISSVALQLLSC